MAGMIHFKDPRHPNNQAKSAAVKAAAVVASKVVEAVPENEFNRDELLLKENGDLLKIVEELVKAARITQPEKTSKGSLVEAIMSAKPLVKN